MLSCTIDAKEARDVATVDIPGAFLRADMDEFIHVRWEGAMAEVLVKLDPILYRMYIINKNGKPNLNVELLKALFRTLFWSKLSAALIVWGFEINLTVNHYFLGCCWCRLQHCCIDLYLHPPI